MTHSPAQLKALVIAAITLSPRLRYIIQSKRAQCVIDPSHEKQAVRDLTWILVGACTTKITSLEIEQEYYVLVSVCEQVAKEYLA